MTTFVAQVDKDRDTLLKLKEAIDNKTYVLGGVIESTIKSSYSEQFLIFYRDPKEVAAHAALLYMYKLMKNNCEDVDRILNKENNVFLKIEELNEYNKKMNMRIQKSYRILVNEFKSYGIELPDYYKDIDALPF